MSIPVKPKVKEAPQELDIYFSTGEASSLASQWLSAMQKTSNNSINKGGPNNNKKNKSNVDPDEEIIKKHFKERPSGLGLGAEQQGDLTEEDFNLDPLGKQLKRKFSQISRQRAESNVTTTKSNVDDGSDEEPISKTAHIQSSRRVVVHKKGEVLVNKHKKKKPRLQ
jgi:hypothetical protein